MIFVQQWDLGEFRRPGAKKSATRWGTKQEFISAVTAAKSHDINVIIDAVLNVSLPVFITSRLTIQKA